MKIRANRNYLIALVACIATTLLALMGKGGIDNWKWFLLSDINVALWLWVAYLFDDKPEYAPPVLTTIQFNNNDGTGGKPQ